jgi:hypothetical protein
MVRRVAHLLTLYLVILSAVGCSRETSRAMPTPAASVTSALVATTGPPSATPSVIATSTVAQATRVASPQVATLPRSIAEAEAEARAHAQAAPPSNPPTPFKSALGTPERTCVEAERYQVPAGELSASAPLPSAGTSAGAGLRSGEFVAGSFAAYIEEWRRDPGFGKLWWFPLHTREMPGLTIRAILLDDPAVTRVFNAPFTAFNATGTFYPSSVMLPVAGRWMLIATSGPDWGCFVLQLT